MDQLLTDIKACTICKGTLPFAPRPVLQASAESKILIIGQAPGLKVQQSGIPWDDASGDELRRWVGVDKQTFYNPEAFALMPMGFCYPGKGTSGDLPPRPECAPTWHQKLLSAMPKIQLTLLIGQYAHNHYLGDKTRTTLTETVKAYMDYAPQFLPLVHPSPRNRIWQKKNPWFEEKVVPYLRDIVANQLIN